MRDSRDILAELKATPRPCHPINIDEELAQALGQERGYEFACAGCILRQCGRERPTYFYGLYDPRLDDVFYVGSTYYLVDRYHDHLTDKADTIRTSWIHAILDDGYPVIPILLHERETNCEHQKRTVEREISAQVRALGHTAMCDHAGGPFNMLTTVDINLAIVRTSTRHTSIAQQACINELIGERVRDYRLEWLDLMNEQARLRRVLREMWHEEQNQ